MPSAMDRETSFIRSALAGAFAAGTATIAFHPLDTIKTVLQHSATARVATASSVSSSSRSAAAAAAPSATLSAVSVRGLYRGVVPATLSMAPACAFRMGVYEVVKAPLLRSELASSLAPPSALIALASAVSVVCSQVVRAPLDMVKTRIQSGSDASSLEALSSAWRSGGLAGIYRGAGVLLARDVPFFSINLALYESLKASVLERRGGGGADGGSAASFTMVDTVLVGAIAQGVAAWWTNPIDLLKTRVQSAPPDARLRMGAALREVLAESGPSGLLRGAGMRVAWIAPQGCVYYPAYELVQIVTAVKEVPGGGPGGGGAF